MLQIDIKGNFSAGTETAIRFGNLLKIRKADLLLEALKMVEPRLNQLSQITLGDEPMIYGDIGLDNLLPLPYMGEGVARLSTIILAIASAPKGIVLIDEIDNGFHYTKLQDLWKLIEKTALSYDVQVFAATHSRECIVAAHNAFESMGTYDFRLHRLEERSPSGTIRAATYDRESIGAAIDMGLEVR